MFLVSRAAHIIIIYVQASQIRIFFFLLSCGQFILKTCHSAAEFRKLSIMGEPCHCFAGCQNGYINCEWSKRVVCFDSPKRKWTCLGQRELKTLLLTSLSGLMAMWQLSLFWKNWSWGVKVWSFVKFVLHLLNDSGKKYLTQFRSL